MAKKKKIKTWQIATFESSIDDSNIASLEATVQRAKAAEASGEWRNLHLLMDYSTCYYEGDTPSVCIEGERLI